MLTPAPALATQPACPHAPLFLRRAGLACSLAAAVAFTGGCSGGKSSRPQVIASAAEQTISAHPQTQATDSSAGGAEVGGGGGVESELDFYDRLQATPLVSHDDAIASVLILATGSPGVAYEQRVEMARRLGLLPGGFDRPGREASTAGEVAQMVVVVIDQRSGRRSGDESVTFLAERGIVSRSVRPYQGLTGAQLMSMIGAAEDAMKTTGVARVAPPNVPAPQVARTPAPAAPAAATSAPAPVPAAPIAQASAPEPEAISVPAPAPMAVQADPVPPPPAPTPPPQPVAAAPIAPAPAPEPTIDLLDSPVRRGTVVAPSGEPAARSASDRSALVSPPSPAPVPPPAASTPAPTPASSPVVQTNPAPAPATPALSPPSAAPAPAQTKPVETKPVPWVSGTPIKQKKPATTPAPAKEEPPKPADPAPASSK